MVDVKQNVGSHVVSGAVILHELEDLRAMVDREGRHGYVDVDGRIIDLLAHLSRVDL